MGNYTSPKLAVDTPNFPQKYPHFEKWKPTPTKALRLIFGQIGEWGNKGFIYYPNGIPKIPILMENPYPNTPIPQFPYPILFIYNLLILLYILFIL